MAKKWFLVPVLAALVACGAFAMPDFSMSAGFGGYFTSDFGGGTEVSGMGMTGRNRTPYAGGGGFVFFDLTFAELSLGFFGGSGTLSGEMTGVGISETFEFGLSVTGLDIGLMGKFPIAMSDTITVFPMLGIRYRVIINAENEDGYAFFDNAGDFSALWFRFGGGMDFSLTESLFLRAGLTYGIRLRNTFERDAVDVDVPGVDVSSRLGHGLDVSLALGFRF